MSFHADRHSPFFRRSLESWTRRATPGFDIAEWLPRAVAEKVTDVRLRAWLRHFGVDADAVVDSEIAARALRQVRSLLMMTLIERDVRGEATLEEVCGAMTGFADLATSVAMRSAAAELAERHGPPCDASGEPQDLLTVGMGKAGGFELNVSSDLDVIFVFREEGETRGRQDAAGEILQASRLATSDFMHRLARRTVNLLAENTEHGFVFRVDTRLRPNGDSGPLVVSHSMLEQYFYAQGREWERFAWLKGRVIADSGLAGADARQRDEDGMASIVRPFVFRRYLDFKAFAALRDLHAMIRAEVAKKDARHEGSLDVKLGRGGIREIEFIAQLFQIVRGGRDPGLRDRSTLATLATLAQRGLIGATDAQTLARAYRLLRRTEHALQYVDDAQTHRLPAGDDDRARIAAMIGLAPAAFAERLALHTAEVQRIFDDLLNGTAGAAGDGDPVDDSRARPDAAGHSATAAVADAPGGDRPPGDAGEPPDAWADGLPESVARRLTGLREGSRYRAARSETRQAIEQVLDAAIARKPGEAGLNRLIDLLEAVSGRGAYVALLAQFPQALGRVLRMLDQAKWCAEYLTRHPIVLDELLDGQLLEPVDYAAWGRQLEQMLADATLNGAPDVERQMDIVREAHHAQVFRLLAQDLEGRHTVERLADLLSELADRVLDLAIRLTWSQARLRIGDTPRFAAIAYGKLGGKELGYASDLDLVFLFDDPHERAQEAYAQLARKLSGWLSTRTAAGLLFEVDTRLRPNGDAGLLATSLDAFTRYQNESAWVWEHQALTRARFAAGDRELGARFESTRRAILARERDPVSLRTEIAAMRRKMLDGHPNRSELFDLKHDRGGMVDIEFIVQYLVLAHSHRLAQLLDNAGNIALLHRAGAAGLIEPDLAQRVADAYRDYRQIQHRMRLNDLDYARIDPARLASEREAVLALWDTLLGPVPARA